MLPIPVRSNPNYKTNQLTPLKLAASGLYYLSELVEEHTVLAKKLLTYLIYSVISIQFLLALIDSFPFSLSLLSICSHGVYAGNLRRFPIVKLSDPLFILSCSESTLTLLPLASSRHARRLQSQPPPP